MAVIVWCCLALAVLNGVFALINDGGLALLNAFAAGVVLSAAAFITIARVDS